MPAELTATERKRLTDLEACIQSGLAKFISVGRALMLIRDERLYRERYASFEIYCQKRWGFSLRYARQLVTAVDAINSLENVQPEKGTSGSPAKLENVQYETGSRAACLGLEKLQDDRPKPGFKQAVELAKAPPEDRAAAWNEAIRDNPKPTVAQVRKAVQARKEQPKPMTDELGTPLTTETLREAFEDACILRGWMQAISALKREIAEAIDRPCCAWLRERRQNIDARLDEIRCDIKQSLPYAVTPAGIREDKTNQYAAQNKAVKFGWITKAQYESWAKANRAMAK